MNIIDFVKYNVFKRKMLLVVVKVFLVVVFIINFYKFFVYNFFLYN